MQLEALQQPPLSVSPEEYEAGKQWILDTYNSCEAKDISRLKNFIEDDATIQFSTLPQIATQEQKDAWLGWLSTAVDRHEHVIHSINVLPDRIIMDYDVVYHFSSGETETVAFITTIDKSTTSPKCKGLVISGNISNVLPRWIAQGGPPPSA
ncbi:hypothetical protein CC1G_11566 [Coprinopsis cinerea okayama7|uniref:SnoaL-like domain-containing protein n=1 Tax=Coprinopsis cinerea (strain Okayama-7 / 130 / ATCC MYA-4618 / FGSC 9003) TaxID=240176 RepID=A8N9R3_COPC7|nr:hypothetical protein CC1G_11566 [Coprinopsis cinerea okayama7\|eukprot:XP_001831569.1 hypothetical protein CC1G_11566 [Coprinopsis cinerea okayama7\